MQDAASVLTDRFSEVLDRLPADLEGLPHVWGLEQKGDNLRRDALCGVARVAWIVRLVETGTGDDDRSMDVMEIARLGDLSDIASLGLSLAEAKQVLAAMQREVVAAQAR